jgi:hypothetical protein
MSVAKSVIFSTGKNEQTVFLNQKMREEKYFFPMREEETNNISHFHEPV